MAMQYERVPVMPTPTADLDGVIYKYAGTSNDYYTRGKYYKCNSISKSVSLSFKASYTFTNKETYVVEYSTTHNGSTTVNGESAPRSGILNGGDILAISKDYYGGGTLTLNGAGWDEVQIDEHDTVKYFSQANVAYLLSELTERLKQTHINE